jgi:hypothetical protein
MTRIFWGFLAGAWFMVFCVKYGLVANWITEGICK